jgi:hypothetical protein
MSRGIIRLSAALALLAAATVAFANSAGAQDLYDCGDFATQEEAQAVFDQDTSDPYGLDGPIGPTSAGVPGVACENLPHAPAGGGGGTTTGGTPAIGTDGGVDDGEGGLDFDCRDFTYQEDAQRSLVDNPADPFGLDADDDGIACETLASAPVTTTTTAAATTTTKAKLAKTGSSDSTLALALAAGAAFVIGGWALSASARRELQLRARH